MPSYQTVRLPAATPEATPATSSATPQTTPQRSPLPSPSEEVTTMAQHVRRILSILAARRIDSERIDALRDAVQREIGLSRPIL